VDIGSSFSCLPRWAAKMIEVVGLDVGDISLGQQTHNQKHHTNVSLMTCVMET
jgi:hypothetical protein